MTYEEAVNLKSFKHYCTCGGYAGLVDRSEYGYPHMAWCAQFNEWFEWNEAMKSKEKT